MSWPNLLKRALAPVSCDSDDQPSPKRVRSESKSPLEDEGAWHILFQYLTTEMTYPQMEEKFISYLGDRYCVNDWKDAQDTLFSADDLNDNVTPLVNLQALYAKHVLPQVSLLSNMASPLEDSLIVASALRTLGCLSDVCKSHRQPCQQPTPKNPFIDAEAEEGSSKDEEKGEGEEGGCSVQSLNVTSLPGPSGKQTFFTAVDNIFDQTDAFNEFLTGPPGTPAQLKVGSTCCMFRELQLVISLHSFERKGLPVTISAWTPGQLYMVSDSPKTIVLIPLEHA
ncbi:uncharacterized protein EDB91DRAFT_1082901 [Suillus paluster]|uniref:uncharacterized protein n=1 Tax=Suillus paluster TaxID=48578 RepID=UPI001B866C12|nr:uncharacterized protein EDB91DRAFT_1082901 [Suillus paluster]KAG1738150.1 hypothetical protein EDB91DRAFT_1082901 [Suillus paluster]